MPYHDPEVTDEDVDKRIEEIRDQKAEYVNVDPRPLEDGDFAVVSLESIGGVKAIRSSRTRWCSRSAARTPSRPSPRICAACPPATRRISKSPIRKITAQKRLAGKTVKFHATVKGIRRKELPELNDEFAQDLGDYRNMDELRDAVRKAIFAQRQYEAQQEAKNKLVDKLVDEHDFPVPEVFVDSQIQNRVEQSLRAHGWRRASTRKPETRLGESEGVAAG